MTPAITVILTSFEQEHLLAQAVRMLCETTGTRKMELLVIDDASAKGFDAVRKLCEDYAERFHSVRLLRMDRNCGVSIVRNVGIEEAKGRYLHFHDGDDLWLPEGWAEGVQRMDQDGLHLSVTGVRAINGTDYPDPVPPAVPSVIHPMFYFPLDNLPYANTFLVSRDVKARYLVGPTYGTRFWPTPTSGEDHFFKIEAAAEGAYARFGEYRIFRGEHWGTPFNPPQWHERTFSEISFAAFVLHRRDLFTHRLVQESGKSLRARGIEPSEAIAELTRPAEEYLRGPVAYSEVLYFCNDSADL